MSDVKQPPEDRLLFELTADSIGNNIQIVTDSKQAYVTVENPWAGSTDTGFGYSCHIELTKDTAADLRDFLTKWIES